MPYCYKLFAFDVLWLLENESMNEWLNDCLTECIFSYELNLLDWVVLGWLTGLLLPYQSYLSSGCDKSMFVAMGNQVKCVAFVHFLFISNAMLGMWGHGAYEFYNLLFMIAMLWAMHSKDSIEAIQTALVIDTSSIFFDIVSIIIHASGMNAWAITFAIINLILRPISVILLYREYNTRGGSTGSVFPTAASTQQRSYQDIDRPPQTVPSSSAGPNVASIF